MIGETIPAALGGMILSILVEILRTPADPGSGSLTRVESDQLRFYFVYIGILATGVTLIYSVLMKERPPSPPSLVSHGDDGHGESISLLKTLEMFKNANFIYLLVIMNADFGMVAVLTGLLGDVLADQKYTQTQVGLRHCCWMMILLMILMMKLLMMILLTILLTILLMLMCYCFETQNSFILSILLDE